MCSKYRSSNVVEVCRNCGWNIAITTACHFDISADAGEAAVGIDGSAGAVRGGDTVSTHYAVYYIHTYIHSMCLHVDPKLQSVEERCGADTVATILRLKPGGECTHTYIHIHIHGLLYMVYYTNTRP